MYCGKGCFAEDERRVGVHSSNKNKISGMFLAVLFFSAAAGFCAESSPAASQGNLAGWHMIWNDEFEGTQIDDAKWRVEDAALVKNNELQYYTPQDVFIHDGVLTLRSRKQSMGGREYTSGLVETAGRFSLQYGRVEIRARLPKGKGLWPAHWMMPESGKWPPEIDIIELLGHSPNTVHMTLHWGKWPDNKHKGKLFTGPDFSEDFHVFAVEWSPDRICWYVDGEERSVLTEHIPKEPFYIILNTAVGGDWPGSPNSATQFPQYHDIDYVRVYAKEIPGMHFLSASAENGTVFVRPKQIRYQHNTPVILSAQPGIGYVFDSWNGDISESGNPVTVTMDGHKQITAQFVPDPYPPLLLSKGKKAVSSSDESEELTAQDAVDGDRKTRWSSAFSDPQWIYVDLGRQCCITAVRLRWEAAYARQYEIQVSDDGNEWVTVCAKGDGKGHTEEITQLNAYGRYVQIYGIKRAREFGYSLWELEVYGQVIEFADSLEEPVDAEE